MQIAYLVLIHAPIICTFKASAVPENDFKAEFMAMLQAEGITYEYALNQTSAIIMYNELLDVQAKIIMAECISARMAILS